MILGNDHHGSNRCRTLVSNLRRGLAALALAAMTAASPALADVSGTVREQGSLTPISDAIVTLQATSTSTVTAPDGSYTLAVPDGSGYVIVAAGKGYYNESVIINAPASGADISLAPVPQDNDPDYGFLTPAGCSSCHPDQYDMWDKTPMARAGLNTWVHDIYDGNGTPGGMGGFVYTRDSIYAGSNPNSECAACHQPEVWVENPGSAMEPPDPTPSNAALHGISCEICHKVADVNVTNINFPGVIAGALTLTRPAAPDFPPVLYGVLGDVDYRLGPMRASYQPQLEAELCGACHQDKNDPDENHTFNGITSEPTYIEWADSPYGDPNAPEYASCVECHMPSYGATTICSVIYPPLTRDPETIRSHEILGTTPEYLENAVEMTMDSQVVGQDLQVEVSVDNSLTGHHVPTGVTIRNMILVVECWMEGDDPLLDPLPHTGTQTIHELGGIGDPAFGYYASLPGKFYAKVNHDASGNGPTFFTDATGIQFDNRIPALATDTTNYTFALPAEGGAVNVRARLIYRRAFRFLTDAKQWTEDGHGNPLADVTAPHYGHLMEMAETTLFAGSTVSASLDCLPAAGTVPFEMQISLSMDNLHPVYSRTLAGRLGLILAGGAVMPNWRSGFANVTGGGSYNAGWSLSIPALGMMIGDNVAVLTVEDVTPAPYNQPPYPAAGSTATATCTVTGFAP